MASALLLLATFLALALLVGIPRIVRRPGLPRELTFQEVPDAELTPPQSAHLSRLDAALGRLQYRPVFNIRVTNLPNPNLSRFYTSSVDPALLLTSLLRVDAPGAATQNEDYVEMITRYQDGTELTTLNSSVTSPFGPVPQRVVQRFPGMDPARLKERHDQAAAGLLAREPLWLGPGEILERWQASHRRWCEHQASRGLLRYERSSDSYRISASTGLRAIAKFLNPIGPEMTFPRLLGALLFATVLPTAGIVTIKAPPPNPVLTVATALGIGPQVAGLLVIGLLLIAGGIAIGVAFGQKHFVGTLVLGLAPALILARTSLRAPLFALLVMDWTAARASAWRNRRRRLL